MERAFACASFTLRISSAAEAVLERHSVSYEKNIRGGAHISDLVCGNVGPHTPRGIYTFRTSEGLITRGTMLEGEMFQYCARAQTSGTLASAADTWKDTL